MIDWLVRLDPALQAVLLSAALALIAIVAFFMDSARIWWRYRELRREARRAERRADQAELRADEAKAMNLAWLRHMADGSEWSPDALDR